MKVSVVARAVGLPYRTVYEWCVGRMAAEVAIRPSRCPRCREHPGKPKDLEQYAYLLGQYLGDGHVNLTSSVPVLRISCADAYPTIIDECEAAMRSVLAKSVHRIHAIGCTVVQSMCKHWPCLFPQAGPGKKHERPIVLEPWQAEIVAAHPGKFLRGLFHSDGCRAVNRVQKNGKTYEYPRYFFSNKSADIMQLCQEALDRLGVEWRMARPDSLSVAKRQAVELLDRHVGPKT
jgi:hypothetical protein